METEMILKIERTREYLDYVERHYNNVQKAWKLLQEKCDGKSFPFMYDDSLFFEIDYNVKNHDLSKLSQQEFVQYRRKFYSTGLEKTDDIQKQIDTDFEAAWENHKKHNAHHWQNWSERKRNGEDVYVYIIECIIDWVAMSFEFGDTAKDYYEKNKDNIDIPKESEGIIYEVFKCLYD